ncbi:thiol:disulfide interchange protein DsbA/DsbL [Aquipseudomonas campi]|uniref:Thiol:disulfide interchange protein n=1 Tax=Aquipseudomonas campi TaxID=2731681 RepID=A0A6M8FZ34_9GAMM|nr:thiol:disulfide interchange protein DsbA/DsbL [Pseudomonas campi]QKE65076.1 thiol:disulfide interchange protein DsbA/DsbL [Pseudomonas campi]
MRNLMFSAAIASLSLFSFGVQAESVEAEPVKAGQHYVELQKPVPVSQPGKIEVVELFWYGCPHCYQLEPTLNAWVEKLPSDVHFTRVPALFGRTWDIHGQLYITLDLMKVEQRVHKAVFDAIHKQGKELKDPEEMADFLVEQGVDRDSFLNTYNSFAVKGQMAKAKQLAKAYQITGVPVLIVNGKYRFDVRSAGGEKQLLQVANYLIDKERAAR